MLQLKNLQQLLSHEIIILKKGFSGPKQKNWTSENCAYFLGTNFREVKNRENRKILWINFREWPTIDHLEN